MKNERDIEYYVFQCAIPVYKIKPPKTFCDYYQTHKDEIIVNLDKENKRLNNIINELEKVLDLNLPFRVIGVRHLKNKLQELKGSDDK